MTSAPSPVRLGIAGWSYDDWKGTVYPRTCRDPLVFCAPFVDFIEINSSFYGIPTVVTAESWVRRTATHDLFFTMKLHREFTHDLLLGDTEIAEFHDACGPLVQAGRLRSLLAQFNFRFDDVPENRWHLDQLVQAFVDIAPVVVELRHVSWQEPEALEWLAGLPISVVHLDYPGTESGFGLRETGILGPSKLAYFRLHGRNHGAWFRKDADRDEVYDYDYSTGEVRELAVRIGEVAAAATDTLVVANNHFEGQAMKTALELAATLGGGKVRVPDLLVQTYPELQKIALGYQRGLFG